MNEQDLDETRRVVYMAIFAMRDNRFNHELAGTLANALLHHSDTVGETATDWIRGWVRGEAVLPPVEFWLACAASLTIALGQTPA